MFNRLSWKSRQSQEDLCDDNQPLEKDDVETLEIHPDAPFNGVEEPPPYMEEDMVRDPSFSPPKFNGNMGVDMELDGDSEVLADDAEDDNDDEGLIPPSRDTTILSHQPQSIGDVDDVLDSLIFHQEPRVRLEIPKRRVDAIDARKMKVISLREKCRQQRTKLALQRKDWTELIHPLLRHFYAERLDSNIMNNKDMEALLESNIKATEDLQQMELEYEDMEKELDREEWTLKEAEARMFRTGQIVEDGHTLNDNTTSHITDGDSLSTYPSGPDRPSALVHSVSEQLAIKRSDAEQVWEQIYELAGERAHVLEQEHQMPDMERPLEYTISEVLDNIDSRSAELKGELQQLHEEIFLLEDKLADLTVLLFSDDQFGNGLLLDDSDTLSIEGERDGKAIEPLDLPPPEEIQTTCEKMAKARTDQSNNIGVFLSYWFQFILVLSHMQLLILRSCADARANEQINERTASDKQLFRAVVEIWKNENHVAPVALIPPPGSPIVRRMSSRKKRRKKRVRSSLSSQYSKETGPDLKLTLSRERDGDSIVVQRNSTQRSPESENFAARP